MSCQRGNTEKRKRQKFLNKTAFKNNLHDTSNKTKKINELVITGCCSRCKEVIEWKIKYKKYKPLSQPKKCVKCLQKAVKNSYYIICPPCSDKEHICGKCGARLDDNEDENNKEKVKNSRKCKLSNEDGNMENRDDDGDDDDDNEEEDDDDKSEEDDEKPCKKIVNIKITDDPKVNLNEEVMKWKSEVNSQTNHYEEEEEDYDRSEGDEEEEEEDEHES